MASIPVGKNRLITTIAAGVSAAATGDTLALDPETFASGIAIVIDRNLSIVGADGRPVIAFVGPKDSHAIKIHANCTLAIKGVDFDINAGAYCFDISGAVQANDCNVRGGGGAARALGATGLSTFTRFNLIDGLGNYGWLFAGKTVRDDGQAFVQNPGAGVELLECKVMKGVVGTVGHVLRTYNQAVVRLSRNKIVQASPKAAAVRIHDGGTAELMDNTIQGDCNFGPMGEGDGGQNLPPGPKREYFSTLALAEIKSKGNAYNTNDFKINPGVLKSNWSKDSISDVKGGAVIDTPVPYMKRVASRGTFDSVKFAHAVPSGRVFSDPNGAKDLHATNCTFDGQPFTK